VNGVQGANAGGAVGKQRSALSRTEWSEVSSAQAVAVAVAVPTQPDHSMSHEPVCKERSAVV